MSELIDNVRMRKETLKHLILQLHHGAAPDAVRAQLQRLMGEVPYALVAEVEQELIASGTLPVEEVQALCDVHSAALRGVIDTTERRESPPGHPVDTFRRENRALESVTRGLALLLTEILSRPDDAPVADVVDRVLGGFDRLRSVDRHYRRKENLLFPYLEKRGITGPSAVMWGKDDEVRAILDSAVEALSASRDADAGSLRAVISLVLQPAAAAVEEMIFKEEQILLPLSLDELTEAEWREIEAQSGEIGFCLIEPPPRWSDDPSVAGAVAGVPGVALKEAIRHAPAAGTGAADERTLFSDGLVRMPSGAVTVEQLTAVLDTLPFDLTFVDAEDRVRYFTQGRERIFDRNIAILGRLVQQCHPPTSVHVVQQILDDFKKGRQDRAPFWIEHRGRFVHIEYFAVRSPRGEYLGTLEVTQDLTELRRLEGEQRLLSYGTGSSTA